MTKDTTLKLKGISIFMVLIGHLISSRTILVDPRIANIATFAVSIFLILSGYGLYKSFENSGLKLFFSKRLSKVIFPYMISTLFFLIISIVLFKTRIATTDFIEYLFAINLSFNFDPTMWFIFYLNLWYLIFYITFTIEDNNILKVSLLFFIAFIFWKYDIFASTKGHLNFASKAYYLCFPFGCLYALLEPKFTLFKEKFKYFGFLWLFPLMISVFFSIFKNELFTFSYTGIFLFLTLLFLIENFFLKENLFSYLGTYSFEIYLVEGILLTYSVRTNFSSFTIILLFFTSTIISSYFLRKTSSYFLKKIHNLTC